MKNSSILKALTKGEFSKDALCKVLLFRGKEQDSLFELARQKAL
jgi:hypothetical protein